MSETGAAQPDGGRLLPENVCSGIVGPRRPLGVGGPFRSGRGVALLSLVVAAAIVASAGLMIWHDRQVALEDRLRGMNGMGIVLVEQTSRYVQVIDMVLGGVQNRISNAHMTTSSEFRERFGHDDFRSYLAERSRTTPQIDAIFLIDADGIIFNWSQDGPVARIDTTDRDYYKYFKEHQDPNLFIGSIWKARGTGQVSLHFARRVSGPDGAFLGVVLGNVAIKYLSDFYQVAGEDLGESIALLRRDGTMLMRYPDREQAIGVKLPERTPWYERVAEGGGSYVYDAAATGVPSVITVHLLHDYPLVINVLMDNATVFAQWRTEAVYIAGSALAASVAFAGLFWTLGRQFRRLTEFAVRLDQGQDILRSYAEMSSDWFWEQDENLRFKFAPKISLMVGKTRWEVAGPAMSEEDWASHKADLADRKPFRGFRWEWIDGDGSRHYVSVSGDPVFDTNGTFTGYRGTARNVTAEVEAAAELETGRQKFEAVLSNITQGICFFDGEGRLQLWNRRFTEIYHLAPDAVHIGSSLQEIVHHWHAAGSTPDTTPADYLAEHERMLAARQHATYVISLRNGRILGICHHPMPGGGWVSTQEDITERHQAEAIAVFMARHDALTKLPNRVLFRERMEQAIVMSARGIRFAVFCLDLDRFKQVNDTMGHPVGDGLLIAVAGRLQACLREVDTVARLGGDEFAIIQHGIRQADDAESLANRIIAAFGQPFDIDGHQVTAGISIGVTVATGESVSSETLMRDADIALYLAKTEGRGTARFFEPEMDARIHLRQMMALELRSAIARNEFELYYQPQVNLITNKVTGFEALLRWHHPDRGFVSAGDFIPIAEETGTIVAIGEWVLLTACFEAESWPIDISVAVNLSPVQFKTGDLVGTVKTALAASGLRPERLELEITESIFLSATAETMKTLQVFGAMGISVALDDFGTGYSSLSYLRSFPFNKIKIDRSFIQDLITSKESISIVRAVTGLGKNLGMKTMAEGVETKEQLDKLREEGCTEVQGYFFSRPRPAGEIPAMIENLEARA
jgi:diguanylate cyclase (GGDEF)-like protein/PAS domain S-box-containing protein